MTAPDTVKLAVGPDAATTGSPVNPFPGLRPFEEDDQDWFFGRNRQIDELVGRLREHRLVTVIGGSGSGKSSLVRAGLLPRLRTRSIRPAGSVWRPVVFTPGSAPLERLVEAFAAELDATDDPSTLTRLMRRTLEQQNGLGALVNRFSRGLRVPEGNEDLRQATNVLFVVDQFEEIFSDETQSTASDQSRKLVDLIVHAAELQPDRVFVVVTMRSENLQECAGYPGFADVINRTSYLVRRLDREELTEVIESPIRMAYQKARRGLDPALAMTVLDVDVKSCLVESVEAMAHDPDHLPLLQHLLYWLWRIALEQEPGLDPRLPRRITMANLAHVIGVEPGEEFERVRDGLFSRCLDVHASRAFKRATGQEPPLDAHDGHSVQRLFRAIAIKDHVQKYKRTPLPLARLGEIGLDETTLRRVIDAFNDEHPYLRITSSKTIDIYHEAIIRKWVALRSWVDQDYERAVLFGRIVDQYREFAAAPDGWRWRGWYLDGRTLQRVRELRLDETPPFFTSRYYDRHSDRLQAGDEWQLQHERVLRYIWTSRWRRSLARSGAALALTAGLVFVGVVVLVIPERTLFDEEAKAFQSFAISSLVSERTVPEIPHDEYRVAWLQQSLVAARFFLNGRTVESPSVSSLAALVSGAPDRYERLHNARKLGEGRLAGALQKILMPSAWVTSTTASGTTAPVARDLSRCWKDQSRGIGISSSTIPTSGGTLTTVVAADPDPRTLQALPGPRADPSLIFFTEQCNYMLAVQSNMFSGVSYALFELPWRRAGTGSGDWQLPELQMLYFVGQVNVGGDGIGATREVRSFSERSDGTLALEVAPLGGASRSLTIVTVGSQLSDSVPAWQTGRADGVEGFVVATSSTSCPKLQPHISEGRPAWYELRRTGRADDESLCILIQSIVGAAPASAARPPRSQQQHVYIYRMSPSVFADLPRDESMSVPRRRAGIVEARTAFEGPPIDEVAFSREGWIRVRAGGGSYYGPVELLALFRVGCQLLSKLPDQLKEAAAAEKYWLPEYLLLTRPESQTDLARLHADMKSTCTW